MTSSTSPSEPGDEPRVQPGLRLTAAEEHNARTARYLLGTPLLGEAMGRESVYMFSTAGLNSGSWVRNFTPQLVIHKKHLATAVYDV